MRRTLFCLLILLTAFRGMVGDAMAYGMTQQAMQNMIAIESVASPADSMPATGHFSPEKAASMPCHETADDSPAGSTTNACTTCQVCHLTASLPSVLVSTHAVHPMRDAPKALALPWHSAELARANKPPIV
ncbi:MAG: hypothetical protein EAZ37_06365 [Burkholderiales bacterium]|nr:MAG: hypothetical protein EAZ37_06365 [Burkholderiales bacterium]